MNDRMMEDYAEIRAKLLEYSVSEQLLNRLEPEQARDLLERIEVLVAKYEKVLQDKADALELVWGNA